MPPTTPEQALALRQIDEASQFLVNVAIHTVRKNPGKFGLWAFGLLICLFFNGFSVSSYQKVQYDEALVKVDRLQPEIESIWEQARRSESDYRRSQGWFWQCNQVCQGYKAIYLSDKQQLDEIRSVERGLLMDAKQAVGVFSEYGVADTRYLYNEMFNRGQRFAKRQSMWDAVFMGMQAMGRDEHVISYALRVLMTVLLNFTLGLIGAFFGFLWNLSNLIVEYRASIWVAITYFLFAALAACSFSFAFLFGIYGAAAATVYVGGKFIVANMRIQDDGGRHQRSRLD